jgi:hypothetical protein
MKFYTFFFLSTVNSLKVKDPLNLFWFISSEYFRITKVLSAAQGDQS